MADSLGARLKQARRLKAARDGRDITQAELARALGVTAVTVSRYESDLQEPSNAVIVQIAAYLGVDPGWLAFGSHSAAPIEAGLLEIPAGGVATLAQAEAEAAGHTPGKRAARKRVG